MSGSPRRFSAIALLLLAAAPADEAAVRAGAAIYNGSETAPGWRAIPADEDYVYPPGTVSCAGCHGEDGMGMAEGGIAAPSLTAARAMDNGALDEWLTGAFAGRGRGGLKLDDRMPRFEMAEADRHALAAFMKTLPLPYQQGVDADTVHIRIDIADTKLSPAAIAELRRRGPALVDEVNVFGRKPVLEIMSAESGRSGSMPPFITLEWGPTAVHDAPIQVQVLDEDDGARCGALLPGIERRFRLLTHWISSTEAGSSRSGSRVTTVLKRGGTGPGSEKVEFDLAGVPGGSGNGLVRVAAGDLVERMGSVRAITSDVPLPVHEAAAISLYIETLRATLSGLSRTGRRLTANIACREIRAELERHHAITLMLNQGEVVVRSAN